MNLLLSLVVPDDLANHFVSPGHNRFFSPNIIRSTVGFTSSYETTGNLSLNSFSDRIPLKLYFKPYSVFHACSKRLKSTSRCTSCGGFLNKSLWYIRLNLTHLIIELITGMKLGFQYGQIY